jgi:hypothetical protein
MHKPFSAIARVGIVAIACSCTASAAPFVSLASAVAVESHAEANSLLGSRLQFVAHAEPAIDARLSKAMIAPEPSAIFLAGEAVDGVIARCTEPAADHGKVIVLAGMGRESFASFKSAASLAWAGEDESYALLANLQAAQCLIGEEDENEVDTKLLTGLPAPEPPALVLAGLAFCGVLCRRSLLVRRRRA